MDPSLRSGWQFIASACNTCRKPFFPSPSTLSTMGAVPNSRNWICMADITLRVNGSEKKVSVSPETPLLWVLRDTLQLTGTKFGCGAGLCGACTVHVEGNPIRSCSTPVSQVAGRERNHDRRTQSQRSASAARGLDRRRSSAMRLLSDGTDHVRGRAAREDTHILPTTRSLRR